MKMMYFCLLIRTSKCFLLLKYLNILNKILEYKLFFFKFLYLGKQYGENPILCLYGCKKLLASLTNYFVTKLLKVYEAEKEILNE